MTIHIDAVYADGVFRLAAPISLPNGAAVRIVVETPTSTPDPLADVIGIGDGPSSGDLAEKHDDFLYGSR